LGLVELKKKLIPSLSENLYNLKYYNFQDIGLSHNM